MLESLRERWGSKALRQVKRKDMGARPITTLEGARHVQLVVPSDDITRFERAVELGRKLATDRRKVQVLSVCLDKHPDSRLLMREGVVLFTRENVSWLYKPTEPMLYDVTSPRPDFLIDFSPQPRLTLQWLVHLSRANLKIGFCEDTITALYDITFAMRERTTIIDQFAVLQQYLNSLSGGDREAEKASHHGTYS